MDTIAELAADERTARVILAVASEPADEVTGRMVRAWGATGRERGVDVQSIVGPARREPYCSPRHRQRPANEGDAT